MTAFLVWVRVEASDRASAHERVAAKLGSVGSVVKVQSEISWKISEEESAAVVRDRRPA